MPKKRRAKLCPVTKKIMLKRPLDAKMALAFGAGRKGSIRYYPCTFCHTYHTTSQPYKKRDALNAHQGTAGTSQAASRGTEIQEIPAGQVRAVQVQQDREEAEALLPGSGL